MKSNILKRIVFRVDFKGIIKIEDVVTNLKEFTDTHFEKFDNTFHNNINIDLTGADPEKISKLLSIPVKEVEQQEIYKYTGSKFEINDEPTTDNVTLQISKYFIILEVVCNNSYKNIDPYLNFFSELINKIKSIESHFTPKRLGLRKIDGKIFDNKEAIFNTFEKTYFDFTLGNLKLNTLEYVRIDTIYGENYSPLVNFKRTISEGLKTDKNSGEQSKAYLVNLDIDGYLNEITLMQENDLTNKLKEINDLLFDIFKESVTKEFLNENM